MVLLERASLLVVCGHSCGFGSSSLENHGCGFGLNLGLGDWLAHVYPFAAVLTLAANLRASVSFFAGTSTTNEYPVPSTVR